MGLNTGEIMDNIIKELVEAASDAMRGAYAPYSRFRVGAAVRSGKDITTGCNLENAAFGVGVCAERVALGAALALGRREFDIIVITTETKGITSPCGACRQVLFELAPSCRVISVDGDGQKKEWRAADLLPDGFAPERLNG